jgi:hypothetical protein
MENSKKVMINSNRTNKDSNNKNNIFLKKKNYDI